MAKGKRLKPSELELRHMILVEKLKPKQIAEKLGYKNGETNIYRYCREYGIEFDFQPNAELRQINLSKEQQSIVLGNILGDGYLHPTNSNKDYYLMLSHSSKQQEYLEWKKEQLMPFILADKPYSRTLKTYGTTTLLSYNTITHPYFNRLREAFYINGTKTVTKDLLNMLDELAVAVWFMDDGSLNKRYGTMMFSTDSFTYDEHLLIQQWFLDKFAIQTVIEKRTQRSGKITYCIRINSTVAKRFREILSPYIPPCMRYKVDYNY